MSTCRCTSLKHPEHAGRVCENLATESDGYCWVCHTHGQSEGVPADPAPKPTGNPGAR